MGKSFITWLYPGEAGSLDIMSKFSGFKSLHRWGGKDEGLRHETRRVVCTVRTNKLRLRWWSGVWGRSTEEGEAKVSKEWVTIVVWRSKLDLWHTPIEWRYTMPSST